MTNNQFAFGVPATGQLFTGREEEYARVIGLIEEGKNVVLGGARGTGKMSLELKVEAELKKSGGYNFIHKNLSHYRTREEFGEMLREVEEASGNEDEKTVFFLDEFQIVDEYEDFNNFLRDLKERWSNLQNISFCFSGSRKDVLERIFNDLSSPLYGFGETVQLKEISREQWGKYIYGRFRDTGKYISDEQALAMAEKAKCNPAAVQQLGQITWYLTDYECQDESIDKAWEMLMNQKSGSFLRMMEELTPKQTGYLKAILSGEKQLTSKRVVREYGLGTAGNIRIIRESFLKNELIELTPEGGIRINDPMFEDWFRKEYPTDRVSEEIKPDTKVLSLEDDPEKEY